MHAFNNRDDISVCSSTTTGVSSFRRNWSFARRESSIHFRDDLSEYSFPSSAGEGPGVLYVYDYRVAGEGLMPRRTVAEAVLRAEWEKQLNEEIFSKKCAPCLLPGRRYSWPRSFLSLRARPPLIPMKTQPVFFWSEVQSIVLLPVVDNGPFRIVITTFRIPEEREWLLQANGFRSRARWAADAMLATLRGKKASQDRNSSCFCQNLSSGPTAKFFMDAALVCCEIAHCQLSPEGMATLAEVLDHLVELDSNCSPAGNTQVSNTATVPQIPQAALRRFGEAVRNVLATFSAWREFRLMVQLLRAPMEVDLTLWRRSVLPFLCGDMWEEFPDVKSGEYPKPIDHALVVAAERCRRTLQ